jgi:putative ABC transport system permease protein
VSWLLQGIVLALRAIRRNVLRAALTVLGILIGVASVVVITALGTGARESVSGQIQAIGSNFLVVFPESTNVTGAKKLSGSGGRLTDDDARAITREALSITAIAPALRARAQVIRAEHNASTSVVCSTQSFLVVRNWAIAAGAMWTTSDENTKAKVVVLGKTIKDKLFGKEDAIGNSLRIGRYSYRVVGVLEAKGEAPLGGDQDDMVLMPISSMRARVLRTPPGFAGVLMMSAASAETTGRAVDQVTAILRQRHRVDEGSPPDFRIQTQKEFQEIQGAIYGVLTVLLVMIAAISLVVGGIGVMNIMLVSVTERTREIGIRMAIGAREADIQTQFLVEAIVLALIGGIAGLAFGGAVIAVLGQVLAWNMRIEPLSVVASLGVSAFIGFAFGFLPAQRAAKLDPIIALRYE